jgi:hypothetical protein
MLVEAMKTNANRDATSYSRKVEALIFFLPIGDGARKHRA